MAPRVLIFGTGAIGVGYTCVLSRKLQATDLVTVCRSNYDAAKKDGFDMKSTIWTQDNSCRPTVVRSVDEAVNLDSAPFDFVIVTAKALPTTPSTLNLIRPAITKGTAIALFQNGIGIEAEYADAFPNNAILSGVCYFATTRTAPNKIEHSVSETCHIGTYPANAPLSHKEAAKSLVSLITDCSATAILHDDVQGQRWIKLLMNTTLNPACALTRCRDVQFIESGNGAFDFFKDIMKEVVAVAQAHGYDNMNEQAIDTAAKRLTDRVPPGVAPSMLADAAAGQQMEVDAVIGNVIKLAAEKDVKIPVLRTVYMLVRALNHSFTLDAKA